VARDDLPEPEQNRDADGGDWPRPMRTLGLELIDASGGYEGGLVVTNGVETASIAGLVVASVDSFKPFTTYLTRGPTGGADPLPSPD
jgi:hypothetical protein